MLTKKQPIMRKSKHREKKLNFLIKEMGVSRYKKEAILDLFSGYKIYTVRVTGTKKWTRYLDETDLYTEFLSKIGIKCIIENDAPRGGKCGTYIFIDDLTSVKKSYDYHFNKDKRKTKNRIAIICNFFGIEEYIINDDLSISVSGDVNLSYKLLTRLPLSFRQVTGTFNCKRNKLTTLQGSPAHVSGNFYCSSNCLTDLIGSPLQIDGDFSIYRNKIDNLEGFPVYVNGEVASDFEPNVIIQAQRRSVLNNIIY
jgi:hypothetical protein